MKFPAQKYLVGAMLAVATSVGAQSQIQVKVTQPYAPGGTPVTWAPSGYGAFYISPYTGLAVNSGHTLVLNCVDFFHNVTLNQVWSATVTHLSEGNIMNTRFNNLQMYMQAAWLTQQYGVNPGSNANRSIAIQSAIWNIFTANAPDRVTGTNPANDNLDSQWWINQSLANWQTVDKEKFFVLTAVGALPNNSDNLQQEFLVYNPKVSVVPEPASLALMSTGVMALGGYLRRRRKNTLAA